MRLNKYLASATTLSRRAADAAIEAGRVTVNGAPAHTGSQVNPTDTVCLDGVKVAVRKTHTTIMLNKPMGYVCSRNGQGSKTIFELLPPEYQHLQPVGRLDKDSSGLLLLTDDGDIANELTHPRYAKTKVYEVTLDKPLEPLHQQLISDYGVTLDDGLSRFAVTKLETRVKESRSQGSKREAKSQGVKESRSASSRAQNPAHIDSLPPVRLDSPVYEVRMHEGRNRQIRRTFAALGYTVTTLHRTQFGSYTLIDLSSGSFSLLN